MPAGRLPKPIQLHRIEGTFRPDRHNKRVERAAKRGATAIVNVATAAAFMARDFNRRAVRSITAHRLVNYVELVDRHERAAIAQTKLDAAGRAPLLSRSGAAVTVSPYIRIMNQCVLLMTKLQSEMGFTPSARASLRGPTSLAFGRTHKSARIVRYDFAGRYPSTLWGWSLEIRAQAIGQLFRRREKAAATFLKGVNGATRAQVWGGSSGGRGTARREDRVSRSTAGSEIAEQQRWEHEKTIVTGDNIGFSGGLTGDCHGNGTRPRCGWARSPRRRIGFRHPRPG
jgi:phage terminase small subunit